MEVLLLGGWTDLAPLEVESGTGACCSTQAACATAYMQELPASLESEELGQNIAYGLNMDAMFE